MGRFRAAVCVAVTLCLTAGCGPTVTRPTGTSGTASQVSARPPEAAPQTVTLTPRQLDLTVGGQQQVTVHVTGGDGQPVAGAAVWFRGTGVCGGSSTGCVTLGDPPAATAVVQTNAAGDAQVAVSAVQVGQGRITAQAAPAGVDPQTAATAEGEATISVQGGAAASARSVVLTADPEMVPAGQSIALTAVFSGPDGAPIAGAPVEFGRGNDALRSARTDSTGTARFAYTPQNEGQEQVWVRPAGGSPTSWTTRQVTVLPAGDTADGAPAALWFDAAPMVAVTGRAQPVAVHVVNGHGQPVAGAVVAFSTSASGTGTWAQAGPVRTDGNGLATDTFTGTGTGAVYISAEADAPGGDPAHHALAQGSALLWLLPSGAPAGPVPASIRVSVSPKMVPAGVQATATAFVTGRDGLPVAAVPVRFVLPSLDASKPGPAVDAVTDAQGRATAAVPAGLLGQWWVSAEAVPPGLDPSVPADGGIYGGAPVLFLAPGDTAADVPAKLQLVPSGAGAVTAIVTNTVGQPVAGASVFPAGGRFGPPVHTDAAGRATLSAQPGQAITAVAVAPGLDESVHSPADPIGEASAWLALGSNGTMPPAAVTLSSDPPAVTVGGATTLSAHVTDAAGHPVSGATVRFTVLPDTTCDPASCESLPSSAAIGGAGPVPTDADGFARVSVTGVRPGGAQIAAQAGENASAQMRLAVTAAGGTSTAAPARLEVTPSPATVRVGERATLTAVVRDAQGAPISGVPVLFRVPMGGGCGGGPGQYLLPPGFGVLSDDRPMVTDANGRASVTFLATREAQVRLDVRAGVPGEDLSQAGAALTGTATVNILPQEYTLAELPAGLGIAAQPTSISVGGQSNLDVRVTGSDGEPLAEVPVTLTLAGSTGAVGLVLPDRVVYTDANGRVQAILTGLAAGTATVEVRAGAPGLGLDPDQAPTLDGRVAVKVTGGASAPAGGTAA